MKFLISVFYITLITTTAMAANNIIIKADQVPVINAEELFSFSNIPTLSKQFPGAKNKEDKIKKLEACQTWVEENINQLQTDKVFKYWCSVRADIVMREYEITGSILIKNW